MTNYRKDCKDAYTLSENAEVKKRQVVVEFMFYVIDKNSQNKKNKE